MNGNGEKIKITVIDDSKGTVEMMKEFLESRNISVSCASDGYTGLEVVEREMPDIVILDIFMPGMDGIEMLKELRKNDATKDISVIFLTGRSTEVDREEALSYGADAYLTKPYSDYELINEINSVLKKKGKPPLL